MARATKAAAAGATQVQPEAAPMQMHVGHNTGVRKVILVFGDPTCAAFDAVLDPDVARHIGRELLRNADLAEGT